MANATRQKEIGKIALYLQVKQHVPHAAQHKLQRRRPQRIA
jgi:hypothetical protein